MSSSFLCSWASWLVILHATTLLLLYHCLFFISLLPIGLRVGFQWPKFLLYQPTFHILTSFGFYWTTFLPCQPISFFLNSVTSSLPLLLPWAFAKSLGFLGLTTTSLPLISFWAYWPLSQPYESTNLFLGLPRPIDFFFTSYYCHGFNTSFFGLPQPICFLFITYYFCGFADHYSCYFGLLGFALLFSLPTFLHIVRFLLSLGFLSKVDINIQQPYILYFFIINKISIFI